MRTWPSAARTASTERSTSSATSTARATFSPSRRPTAAAASSSGGSTPSRRSGCSMLVVVLPARPLLLHRVQDGPCDVGLGGSRDRALGPAPDDRDLVLGHLEADVGAGDVVDHHEVKALALELFPRQLDGALTVLGGEADQCLAGPARAGERRQDVLGALQAQVELVGRL